MFEKEAEFYAREKYSLKTDGFIVAAAEDAFKDGAEFGYKKCQEELQMYIHKLTKAKKIIQHFVDECKMCRAYPEKYKMWYQEIEKAEKFIKEEISEDGGTL